MGFSTNVNETAPNMVAEFTPSTADIFVDNFKASFNENITSELFSRLDDFATPESEKSVTGAQLNEEFGINEFDPEDTFSNNRANDLRQWRQDQLQADLTNEAAGFTFTSFAAGLAGGFLDPVAMIGGGVVGKLGATAYHLGRTADTFSDAWKASKSLRRTSQVLKNEFIENFAGSLAFDVPAIGYIKANRGEELQAQEALQMVVGNSLLGTALSTGLNVMTGGRTSSSNITRKLQQKYGSTTKKAIAAQAELERVAAKNGGTVDATVKDEAIDAEVFQTRDYQSDYEYAPSTREGIYQKDYYISRYKDSGRLAESSKNGIGTVTLSDNPNIAENLVSNIDENGGAMYTVRLDQNTNAITDADIVANKQEFFGDLEVDLKKTETLDAIVDKLAEISDEPLELMNSKLRGKGIEAYVRGENTPNGGQYEGLVVLDDSKLEVIHNQAEINTQTGNDGFHVNPKGMTLQTEKVIPKLDGERLNKLKSKVQPIYKSEVERLNDPLRNGQIQSTKIDEDLKGDAETTINETLAEISEDSEVVKDLGYSESDVALASKVNAISSDDVAKAMSNCPIG